MWKIVEAKVEKTSIAEIKERTENKKKVRRERIEKERKNQKRKG